MTVCWAEYQLFGNLNNAFHELQRRSNKQRSLSYKRFENSCSFRVEIGIIHILAGISGICTLY